MPQTTQANRRIELTTPLGADVLLVRRASIQEQISRLFHIELELSSDKIDIDFNEIVGKNVTLRLDLPGQQKRFFNGFVNRFVQNKAERGFASYRATVVPWLWFLTRSADCKIFQQSMPEPPDPMTVPGIVKKVFKDHGFEDFRDDALSGDYREWEFCVQYRETAFNFVSRLLEQEGIAYYFEHEDGKHTLVLTDSMDDYQPFENYDTVDYHPHTQGGNDKEAITDWVVEKEVQPTTYILNDFNFQNPKQAPQKGLVVNSTISREHEKADFTIYDYPGEFQEHGEGEFVARLRIEELQTQHEIIHGHATARGLGVGRKFMLKNHPRSDQNRECVLTRVSMEIDAGEFEAGAKGSSSKFFSCSFTAIDVGQSFRPTRVTPKPVIQGVQTALVVGPSGEEIHTDEHARIKVQFHWDRYGEHDENSSCWIRVSHANAGKGWGSMITPRIGQEVIVEFLEGDPDRPIVTGRVYNGDQKAPYAGGTGVVAGMKSQTHKGNGSNEMSMDDTAGAEKITIHAHFDMNTTVDNNQTDVVHNNRTSTVDVDDTESIGSNQEITVGCNQKTSVGADQEITVGSNQKTTVGADQENSIGSNQTTSVGSNQETSVGSNQSNSVGSNLTEDVGANRSASIGGNEEVAVTGSCTIDATGEININSAAKITLSAGGSTIEIGPAGVTIQTGAKVTVQGAAINLN
jgi:type VI secretion system secreted protein VgrG